MAILGVFALAIWPLGRLGCLALHRFWPSAVHAFMLYGRSPLNPCPLGHGSELYGL